MQAASVTVGFRFDPDETAKCENCGSIYAACMLAKDSKSGRRFCADCIPYKKMGRLKKSEAV
jgi:hypothetical protein